VEARRVSAAICLPLAWLYASFAGASGSALRAAWMLTALLLARAIARRSSGPRAFALSLLAAAAVDPLCAFDLSLLLSAAATAGLLFVAPVLEPHIPGPRWIAKATAATVAATIACAPIIARFAPSLPLGGVVANLVAVPIGEAVALPLCLVHPLVFFWPAAEQGCATAASGALVLVRGIARAFSGAMAVPVPLLTSWQLVTVGAGFLRPRLLIVLVGIGILLEPRAPRGVLRATFLDVGQGDAALIDLPDGTAILIDGGGFVGSPVDTGTRVIVPELRARRRGALRAVVLSHPHPDHFGGLPAALRATEVGELWDTGQGEEEGTGGGYAELLALARARGTRVLRPPSLCGERWIGGA
jgi:competence protein ComEC